MEEDFAETSKEEKILKKEIDEIVVIAPDVLSSLKEGGSNMEL